MLIGEIINIFMACETALELLSLKRLSSCINHTTAYGSHMEAWIICEEAMSSHWPRHQPLVFDSTTPVGTLHVQIRGAQSAL